MSDETRAQGPGSEVTAATESMFACESDKSGLRLTPLKELIFDEWIKADVEPLGGRPTGGVQQAIANIDSPFKANALPALKALAKTGRIFEPAYALEREFGVIPDHPNYCGAIVRQAVEAGIIRRVDYRPSERPSRNGGVVGWYQGVQSEAW